MQYTFGLIVPGAIITSILNSTPIIRLCGSLPELGSWSIDKAPQLNLLTKELYRPIHLSNEPRFYRLDINISKDVKEFDYKYVINDVMWEGKRQENRVWFRDDCKNLVDGIYYTPIDYWIDVDTGATDEKTHTSNFYNEIVRNQIMHYGRVNDKLYVGGCPRTLEHIENVLKKELNVTAVLNLQVVKDIERNCKKILGDDHVPEPNNEYDLASVDILRKAYEQAGILFLWVPITDLSSTGRELMSPQATLVLKTVLEKGHKVYVHCNAGVGRAFGIVCAYHHFVLKTPLPKVHYDLAPIRSCGFFDRVFLENAEKIYKKAYE
ncbi:unnamed protein product [Adineta steineri]|uniref:Uncharacterized protein n=2 Tax=Adineta steineri TaxID=433720 RepID=A0A815Z4L5_9BILA|nr:unnamed protein product [Adineta steineri]CAF1308273.1 unnamed protein product [Adineta steineri]CAF1400822.1 unnamed protein product [Adineta steineri]CAF1476393.1 unnamed protein product [Adineta steineri]CAF1578575.1 unnamed protein product [Adineta steineri]